MKKQAVFCHYPWMASYEPERCFVLIFSVRDDLVKVSWKSDGWKCQNQVTLLTLTSWVKGTSPLIKLTKHVKQMSNFEQFFASFGLQEIFTRANKLRSWWVPQWQPTSSTLFFSSHWEHSLGISFFIRYALKKKTILFGNFSQTSDPPHPSLENGKMVKSSAEVLH